MKKTKLIYPELTYVVIGAAMEVHNVLGPGYLEQVYEGALSRELILRNVPHKRQWKLPVIYKDVQVGYYVADIVVEGKLILELKSVSRLNDRHVAQVLNYLTTTKFKLALLLNFGGRSLSHRRIIG